MSGNDQSAFKALVGEILSEFWRQYPSAATILGVHDYDAVMDNVDITTRKSFLAKERIWLSKLEEFETAGQLSCDDILDLKMLRCNLQKDMADNAMFNRFERDPSLYPANAIFSCLIFLMRDFGAREERYRSMISRLNVLPRYLQEAKANLRQADSIPELWLGMAVEIAETGQQFFSRLITQTCEEIQPLKNDMLASATVASRAFQDYASFLRNELSQNSQGGFASGREYFELLLKNYHMLPYSADELEATGLEYIDKTTREMNEVASAIDSRRDAFDIIEEMRRDTPVPDELLSAYKKEVARSRDFVVKNRLVTLPLDESLEVIETPPSERSTLPYAAYMSPAPFEITQKGFFWVTPVNLDAGKTRIAEQLSGHSRAAIEVRTLHEGYPGHHLQLCLANRLQSRVRRIFSTSVFVEGWALYCEELMKRNDYYTDRKVELIQLKDQLWRGCRIVIDVRLHTGRMSFNEAVDMLVNTARLERSSAEAEVRRYSQSPTQPMSYLIGKIELERLMKDFLVKYPDTTPCEIHDRLLSYGSVPVALLRETLLGTN